MQHPPPRQFDLVLRHGGVQGRAVELASCLVQGNGVLLVVSPGQAAPLAARLQKYILYGDQARPAALRAPLRACSPELFLSPTFQGLVAVAECMRAFSLDRWR